MKADIEPTDEQLKAAFKLIDNGWKEGTLALVLAKFLAEREAKLNFELNQARALNTASVGAIERLETEVSVLSMNFGGLVDSITRPLRKAIAELCEALENRVDIGSTEVDELLDRVKSRAWPKEKDQDDVLRALRDKLMRLENECAHIAQEAKNHEAILRARIKDLETRGNLLCHEVDMVTDGEDAPVHTLPVAAQAKWKIGLREASVAWRQLITGSSKRV